MTHHLHQTYTVARIRQNRPAQRFRKISDLSYPPKGIGGYQRANTPETTLFYSASCERRDVHRGAFTDFDHGIKVALFETLSELRENGSFSRGSYTKDAWPDFMVRDCVRLNNIEITYGIWESLDTLHLARVAPLSVYDGFTSDLMLQQHIFYRPEMQNPERHLNDDIFWGYLAREFSKLGRHGEPIDYSVSAVAAEVLFEMGYDGVSYPSTRADGLGINIALAPRATDSHMRCIRVGRALISISGNQLRIEHRNTLDVSNGETSFDLYSSHP